MLYNFYDFMLIKPSHCTENQTHLLILFHRILHCLTHVFPSTLSSVLSYFSTHKPSWTSFCPSNISSLPPPHLGFQQTLFLLCGIFCSPFFPRLAPHGHFRPHLKCYKRPFLRDTSNAQLFFVSLLFCFLQSTYHHLDLSHWFIYLYASFYSTDIKKYLLCAKNHWRLCAYNRKQNRQRP